jgi:hypothetical protein
MGQRQICLLALLVVAPVSAVLVGHLGSAAAVAICSGFHKSLFV